MQVSLVGWIEVEYVESASPGESSSFNTHLSDILVHVCARSCMDLELLH